MQEPHYDESTQAYKVVRLPAEPGYISYGKDDYAPMALNIHISNTPPKRPRPDSRHHYKTNRTDEE